MTAAPNRIPTGPTQSWAVRAICLVMMLMPSILLMVIAARTPDGAQTGKPTVIGAAVFASLWVVALIAERGIWRASTGKIACLHFASSLGVLWYARVDRNLDFWAANLGLIALPVILMLLPAAQALTSVQRRARLFIERLSARTHWPEDLQTCAGLPEVSLLSGMLAADAEPAMAALNHPRPEVRMVVLTALYARERWARGQEERVLAAATYAQEPPVRAAALRALGGSRDPYLIQRVAEFSTDSSPEVRRATFESLLSYAPFRWLETRRWIHAALGDRRFLDDGPLPPASGPLPDQAYDDLAVWACEPGICSRRSLASLMQAYRVALQRGRTPELLRRLHSHVVDPRLHSTVRVEIAFLLRDQLAFSADVLRRMLEHHQPSQIRLLAAGELLANGFDEHALEALREVAKQPNREMALGVAKVLQATMQIDMGLPNTGSAPAANTRAAAEVARRVSLWTKGKWPADSADESELTAYQQTPGISEGNTATFRRTAVSVNVATIDTPWLE